MAECLVSYCKTDTVVAEKLLCPHHETLMEETTQVSAPTFEEMGYLLWTLGAWYDACKKNLCDGSEFIYDPYWLLACWEEDKKTGGTAAFGDYRGLAEECSTRPIMAFDASSDLSLRIATPEEVVASGVAWVEGKYGLVESTLPAVDGPDTWLYVLPDGWTLPRIITDESRPLLPLSPSKTGEHEKVICLRCFCNHTGTFDGNLDACTCHFTGGFIQPLIHDYVPDPDATPVPKAKVPPRSGTYLGTPEPHHGPYGGNWVPMSRRTLRDPVYMPELEKVIVAAISDDKDLALRRRPLKLRQRMAGSPRKKGSPPPSGTYIGANPNSPRPALSGRTFQQAINDGDFYKLTWKKTNAAGEPSNWTLSMPGCRGLLPTLQAAVDQHAWPPGTEIVANIVLEGSALGNLKLGPDIKITLPDRTFFEAQNKN